MQPLVASVYVDKLSSYTNRVDQNHKYIYGVYMVIMVGK